MAVGECGGDGVLILFGGQMSCGFDEARLIRTNRIFKANGELSRVLKSRRRELMRECRYRCERFPYRPQGDHVALLSLCKTKTMSTMEAWLERERESEGLEKERCGSLEAVGRMGGRRVVASSWLL